MDRIINGFSDRGNWYRGNLHSHTTVSDGVLTPEESVKAFREQGYSFLCISDHNTYTDFRKKFNDEKEPTDHISLCYTTRTNFDGETIIN